MGEAPIYIIVIGFCFGLLIGFIVGVYNLDDVINLDYQKCLKTKNAYITEYEYCVQIYNDLRGTCRKENSIPKLLLANISFENVSMDN